ncbi:MAG: hypothetical protein Q7T50_03815 [Candidatus Magasanikbacteria bacterium]|nr:hypothetical protein [Candidatus Magasanikbacteria bacterium]
MKIKKIIRKEKTIFVASNFPQNKERTKARSYKNVMCYVICVM